MGWWLWLALHGAGLAQEVPAEVEAAQVRQEALPAWTARAQRAQARIDAAEQWFAGAGTLDGSWPAHAGVDVLDPSYLRAWRRELAAASEVRAAERVAPLPSDAKLAAEVRTARDKALDLEERFASLELRLLSGLRAGLAEAPDLGADRVAERVASLNARVAAADDEASQEVLLDAARAAEALRSLARLRLAAVKRFTVPGDDSLTAWVSQALASEVSADLLGSLQAARPLLAGDAADAVDALLASEQGRLAEEAERARQARVEALQALLDAPPPLTDDETPESLQAMVDEARVAADAASDAEREELQLQLLLAEKRLAIQQGQLAEDAAAAQRRADEARQTAEATRLEGAKEDQALSALRDRVLAVQQAVAEVYEDEARRRELGTQRREQLRDRLDGRIEAGANAVATSLLDPGRQDAVDRAYLDLRTSVRSLYEELDILRADEQADQADTDERLALLEGWGAGRGSDELAKLDDAFQAASTDLSEALGNRDRTRKATRDEVYRLLDVSRDNRRLLKEQASSAARAQARRDFFPELRREVMALPGQLAAGARGIGLSMLAVPAFLGNLDALWGILLGSFELVVLVGVWGVARRQMATMMSRALDAVQERMGAPLEGDRASAVAQLASLGQSLLDLFTGLFLFSRLDGMGGLGLVVLLWVAWAGLRVGPRLARASLSSPKEMHPSLRLVTAPTEDLAARTLWWVAAWAGASKLGTFAMVSLFDADRLRDVVGTLSSFVFWLLLAAFVYLWGPVAAATLAHQSEHTPVTAFASRPHQGGRITQVLRLPQYVVALVVVVLQLTIHLFGRLIEGQAGLGWLQAAIARRQLKADDNVEAAPRHVPEAVAAALAASAVQGMPRPDLEARLVEAHTAWKETGRRGLVSVIGEGAAGKSQFLDHVSTLVDTPVVRLQVHSRLHSSGEVLRFLAEGLGLEATDETTLMEGLAALPPKVITIDRGHLLFLRRVRGYDPLQSLVEWMTATSDRHFWVLSVHEPAWDYLNGVAARLKMDAFRDHLRLGQVPGDRLAQWLEGITREAGYELSYDGLATTGLLGGDEELAERRARGAFWRLLADAAGGVPGNAVVLWGRSLSETGPSTVDVVMFEAPSADDIDTISDEFLFALTALVQHERLTVDELASVLNRRPGAARTSARYLLGLDLAVFDAADATYSLPALWAPAVQRLLRQKHFLFSE